MTERYIHIRNWDRFQHYGDRAPDWIKTYTGLMSDDDYLNLTFHKRGVLLGLWLEYARGDKRRRGETTVTTPPGLSDTTLTLTRRLGQRVLRADLEALNRAGFIHFSASQRLPLGSHMATPEKRREEKRREDSKEEPLLAKQEPESQFAEKPYVNNIAGDIGARITSLEQARERRTA